MKKMVFALALVIGVLMLSPQVSAQSRETGFQIMSFDIGYAPSWSLTANNLVVPVMFGVNLRITESLIVGFQRLDSNGNLGNYFNIKYGILPRLRATLSFGGGALFGAGTKAGFGFEAVPFSRTVGGTVTTEFKTAFQYIAPVNNVANGGLVFGLVFGVGF